MFRFCAACNKKIIYSTIKKLKRAEKNKKTCRSCSAKRMWKKPDSNHNTSETKQKISKSIKNLHKIPGYTERTIRPWINASQNTKVSKLELKPKQQLNKFGFLHSTERNLQFIGPYVPDYVNFEEKLIVEIYGDYWHANPKKYSSNDYLYTDKNLNLPVFAKDCWEKHDKRENFYNSLGWKVIVFWESEIKSWDLNNI